MYVACRRNGYVIEVVHRHWEGITEVNKLLWILSQWGWLCWLFLHLGQSLRKHGFVSAALVSASGPPSAGRCSCALQCNGAHAVLLSVAAVFREKVSCCWLFWCGKVKSLIRFVGGCGTLLTPGMFYHFVSSTGGGRWKLLLILDRK